MNKEFYISLISKKLSNELNSAELKDLSHWLAKDSDNSVLLDQFKSAWDTTARYKENVSFNADTAFAAFADKYEIPQSDSTVDRVGHKSSVSKNTSRWIFLGLLLTFILFISAYFLGLNKSTTSHDRPANLVLNSTMDSETFGISDNSSVTLSPNSNFVPKDVNTSLTDNKSDNSLISYNKSVNNFTGQGFFDLNNPDQSAVEIGLDNDNYIVSEDALFNVQNFEDDNFSIVDVQTGQVTFVAGDETITVNEGERLIYNEKTEKYNLVDLPKVSPFKWVKGILEFDNTPLAEAFVMIERFYGVDIDIVDHSSTDSINFTATHYKSSSLDACMELVQGIAPMDVVRTSQRKIEISNIGGE